MEDAIPLDDEKDESPFTVYEDVRQKLIAGGMPPEQIAFIHDANTNVTAGSRMPNFYLLKISTSKKQAEYAVKMM